MPLLNIGYLFFLILITVQVMAADVPFQFENEIEQERYMQLTEELRCLVCQNQSLADSHADLAQDLRDEIFKMIREGKSNKDIVDFLVSRYGDFVLYRPPVNRTTWLLWFGPFFLFLGALSFIVFFVRSRKTEQTVLDESDKKRVSRLLAGSDSSGD